MSEGQKALVIIWPKTYKDGEYYPIVRILKHAGLEIRRHRILTPSKEVVETHNTKHQRQETLPASIELLYGRLAVLEVTGIDAITRVREHLQAYLGEAMPGTNATEPHYGAIYASTDACVAEQEIDYWLNQRAIVFDTQLWRRMEEIPRPTKP